MISRSLHTRYRLSAYIQHPAALLILLYRSGYDSTLLRVSLIVFTLIRFCPCDLQSPPSHLQSAERFQAGDAVPGHPLPRGPRRHEEEVRAAVLPERAQPVPGHQSPLQPRLSAGGPAESSGRADVQAWTTSRPQPHVGFCLAFPVEADSVCPFAASATRGSSGHLPRIETI